MRRFAPLAWWGNVVVIQDAAALRHPEWYARSYVAWQRAGLPTIARSAVRVVSPSSFSRDEVVELPGASPDRVVVIGGGVDERFGPDREAAGRAARALGLEHPYVLTVGSLIARKNLGALARAAGALAGR